MNRNVSPTLVYAAALVLAACSLLYELLIAQTLAMLAANTVVWYSVTIGIYLAAMGLAFAPGLPPPFPFYPGPPPWAEGGAPMPMDPRQIPAPIQGQPY